ncbi:MAG: hypothetical protein AAGH46_08525 [Bacteroidota bacterium]
MKDSAPAAIMIFFMAIVALVLLDDLTSAQEADQPTEIVENELKELPETDLATTDQFD